MTTKFNVRKCLAISSVAAAMVLAGQSALAQIEGEYKSDGGDDCALSITAINIPAPKFADAYYRIESRGVAACMWDGVGISHSTNLAGSYITLPPVHNRVYFSVKWLFGPTSPKIEMVQRNEAGEYVITATYTRQ
ncbi:MAG: hypothetical protein Q7W55_11970 [Pseudohongiella sp.]|nr:hypothetical protein [Pseudohongiella sp.]MDO9519475.1 hypothetical protein [Pseudohongiella sp.]MDP2127517.1 hypothetical protein [Pseudohongiella sp.]